MILSGKNFEEIFTLDNIKLIDIDSHSYNYL